MLFKSKKIFLGLAACGVIVLSSIGVTTYYSSKNLSTLSQFKDGIAVCHARVANSYRSLAQKVTSEFTVPSFYSATEECFADAKNVLAQGDQKLFNENSNKVNSLLTDVYWLHQAGAGNLEELSDRFAKIDNAKIDLDKAIASKVSSISRALNYQLISLLSVFIGVAFCMAVEIQARRKMAIQDELYELKAIKMRQVTVTDDNLNEAGELISSALKYHDLNECSGLCDDIVTMKSYEASDREVKEIIIEKEPRPEFVNDLDVAFAIDRVLDLMQSKLNAQGLCVDIRGELNHFANIGAEDFSELFHAAMSNILARNTRENSEVSIVLAESSNSVQITSFDHGRTINDVDVNALIAKDIVRSAHGEFEVANSSDSGRVIKVTLPIGHELEKSSSTRTTTKIVKTTKREWMKQMAEQFV